MIEAVDPRDEMFQIGDMWIDCWDCDGDAAKVRGYLCDTCNGRGGYYLCEIDDNCDVCHKILARCECLERGFPS